MLIGTAPLAFTFGLGVSVLFPMRAGASTVPIGALAGRGGRGRRAPLDHDAVDRPDDVPVDAPRRRPLPRALAARVRVGGGAAAGGRRHGVDGAHRHAHPRRHRVHGDAAHLRRLARRGVAAGVGRPPVPGYEAGCWTRRCIPSRRAWSAASRCAARPAAATSTTRGSRSTWSTAGPHRRRLPLRRGRHFWFAARNDDLIVSAGYNISPLEVEAALLQHDAVAECAVVASPDEARGHVVKAFVVAAEGVGAGDELVWSSSSTSRPGSRPTSTRGGSSSSTRFRAR